MLEKRRFIHIMEIIEAAVGLFITNDSTEFGAEPGKQQFISKSFRRIGA